MMMNEKNKMCLIFMVMMFDEVQTYKNWGFIHPQIISRCSQLAQMGKNRNTEYIKKFGNRLLKLRTERGWSQYDLAATTGIDRSQLGKIERGEYNATLSTLKVIADAFDISVSELMAF